MAPVIVAKDLYKCYPGFSPVLRGIAISVEPGEMVAIMGPSGCGKSTMLHILGMLHAPDAGSLEVLGTDVRTLSREETAAFRRGNMGFVMQSSNLFEHSTVFENVEFPLIYERVEPQLRWERVIRALELVRLSARVHYRSNHLSGGEQQRVAVARAMVNNPRILLADEPTGSLDARTSKAVMENFRTLAHQGRVAMVVVTHDPGVAEYCDSVYTLDEGMLHVRRKNPVPRADGDGTSLLGTAPRRLNAACVVGCFPRPMETVVTQDMLNLHTQRTLARVYSLHGAGLTALVGGDRHGLPVPMRRMGLWDLLRHVCDIFKSPLRHTLLLRAGLGPVQVVRALAAGSRMAAWGLEDRVEHLHAPGGADGRETAVATYTAAHRLGIPFSFTVRAQNLNNMPADLLAPLALTANFVRCDSEGTLEAMRRACPDAAEKCVLLRNSMTLPLPEESEAPLSAKSRLEGQTGQVALLAVPGMRSRKGLAGLLRTCQILRQEQIPFHLTIAGSSPGLWGLRWKARLMGLRRHVTFAGQVTHENMPDLLRKANIFMHADIEAGKGRSTGFPQSLAEAMLYALPIVATDIPSTREILQHERNALLTPPPTTQIIAQAMAQALLRFMRFPDMAKSLGKTAQEDARLLFETEDSAHGLADILLHGPGTPRVPSTQNL